MMPLADLVFDTGAFSNRQLIYAIPCSVIAAMSIEQMGAVLIAFEGLSILSLLIQKKKNTGGDMDSDSHYICCICNSFYGTWK